MGIRINTNVAALNTRRHLFNTTNAFGKSMEKLSSGLRINRAADDAAGLAISEILKSDVRALDQASRNASDGISLVQIAEGALDEVSNILLRMKELGQQAANGTLSADQIAALQAEYDQLTEEISRIHDSTAFNEIVLLDGSAGQINIQVSIGTGDNIEIDLDQGDVSGLTLAATVDDAAAIDNINAAIVEISSARAYFGAVQNRLESSIRNMNNTAENLAAANSRIRDVDVAAETSRLTSFQILQQAGVAMLSQANMSAGLAMALLQ
jgi:flagellin